MPHIDFAEFLTELDHGRINATLGEQLEKVVEAVKETGRAGALTIKVAVGKEGQFAQVDVTSTMKAPQNKMNGTVFYFLDRGGLAREDPRQLPLKDVGKPKLVDLPAKTDRKSAAAGEREGE